LINNTRGFSPEWRILEKHMKDLSNWQLNFKKIHVCIHAIMLPYL
jgi:hypothetical protein